MSSHTPPFKLCLAGHSLVLPDFDHPLCDVSVFRKPGAHVQDFDHAPLNQIFHSQWDLIVLQIGGNDLCSEKSRVVYHQLLRLVLRCQQVSNRVEVLGIELRRKTPFFTYAIIVISIVYLSYF